MRSRTAASDDAEFSRSSSAFIKVSVWKEMLNIGGLISMSCTTLF